MNPVAVKVIMFSFCLKSCRGLLVKHYGLYACKRLGVRDHNSTAPPSTASKKTIEMNQHISKTVSTRTALKAMFKVHHFIDFIYP